MRKRCNSSLKRVFATFLRLPLSSLLGSTINSIIYTAWHDNDKLQIKRPYFIRISFHRAPFFTLAPWRIHNSNFLWQYGIRSISPFISCYATFSGHITNPAQNSQLDTWRRELGFLGFSYQTGKWEIQSTNFTDATETINTQFLYHSPKLFSPAYSHIKYTKLIVSWAQTIHLHFCCGCLSLQSQWNVIISSLRQVSSTLVVIKIWSSSMLVLSIR